MRRILVIGIGAGSPDYLTLEAIAALTRADAVFLPDKGEDKSDLNRLRTLILDRHAPAPRRVTFSVPERTPSDTDYAASIDDWRTALEAAHETLLRASLAEGETGAFLVWGDPAIYDGTIGTLDRLRAMGLALELEIVPGISAVQALAARHRIALNRIGQSILVTTGRRLAAGFPAGADNVVVMLDSKEAFAAIDPDGLDIWWGAYLGTPDEILIAGPLAEVRDQIVSVRRAARARHGWLMDTYLLRRR